ncbi:MAG: TspO/MBR family protein [Actinomycetota bacterium]
MTFFESLVKPSWIPPDWAFPLAWSLLWALQAAAGLVLIGSDRPGRVLAIGLLVAQFAAAVAWQSLVFGPGRLTLAAWWLLAVLVLVTATVAAAARVSIVAAAMIAPTVAWMTVATALGFALLRLNPGR